MNIKKPLLFHCSRSPIGRKHLRWGFFNDFFYLFFLSLVLAPELRTSQFSTPPEKEKKRIEKKQCLASRSANHAGIYLRSSSLCMGIPIPASAPKASRQWQNTPRFRFVFSSLSLRASLYRRLWRNVLVIAVTGTSAPLRCQPCCSSHIQLGTKYTQDKGM